ncbi:MAG: alpha-galactosidase [Salinivirgaceae bacterium]|nr:alpha-galactosidase [Salinivirgaceae bacterium]
MRHSWLVVLFALIWVSRPSVEAQTNRTMQSPFFDVLVNSGTGTIIIGRPNKTPFISGAFTTIHYDSINFWSPQLTEKVYVTIEPFTNELGKGRKLIYTFMDTAHALEVKWEIGIYDSLQALTFETTCTNRGQHNVGIKSIEPLAITEQHPGYLYWTGAQKCLTNGAMYYDAGTIHTFGDPYQKPEPYGETKGGVMLNQQLASNPRTIQSWWNIGIFSGYDKEGLSLGYIENKSGLGRIQVLKNTDNQISLVAESVLNPGLEMEPGQTISSDRFMINIADNPYQVLEDYADIMAKAGKANIGGVVNGWCNWFYTLDHFTEDEIIKNAQFAAKHLKPYGLEYIQIDEGFQTWHGEWEGNSRFPHGLKWLASQIKLLGLKPSIWISPFVVSDTTEVFKKHPDWFLKTDEGTLKRIGPWPNENTDWFRNEIPKRYALDITHPGAGKWFTDLIDTLANNWGFEMIKVDFVAWTVFSAHHFYDTSATPAQVYTKALQIMRKTVGDECHLLDCGPGNISIGSINSMRIEYDQNYGYFNEVWKQYFLGTSCSAGAVGKRYFYHNRTWTNDADHVCIDLLSNTQAQAVASLISLSGGNMMSGDRLTYMNNGKLEILHKIFPATGTNAKPVDLFDMDPQTAFAVNFNKGFDQWTVAGFFNHNLDSSITKVFPLHRLWLDPKKTYLVYDFWDEHFVGEINDSLEVKILPGNAKLFSLHEKKTIPQFISTTRHAMQGVVELDNIHFDSAQNTLSGTSTGPLGSSHDVIIFIPADYYWVPKQAKLYDDFHNYSVKMADNQILRVRLQFNGTDTINWEIQFKK